MVLNLLAVGQRWCGERGAAERFRLLSRLLHHQRCGFVELVESIEGDHAGLYTRSKGCHTALAKSRMRTTQAKSARPWCPPATEVNPTSSCWGPEWLRFVGRVAEAPARAATPNISREPPSPGR